MESCLGDVVKTLSFSLGRVERHFRVLSKGVTSCNSGLWDSACTRMIVIKLEAVEGRMSTRMLALKTTCAMSYANEDTICGFFPFNFYNIYFWDSMQEHLSMIFRLPELQFLHLRNENCPLIGSMQEPNSHHMRSVKNRS